MPDSGVPCGDIVRECRELVSHPSDAGCVAKIIPFSQAFGPLLAFITVVVGWRWVSRDNNRRESRKEVRAQLNEIADLVRQVEESARTYYQTGSDDPEAYRLSMVIKRDLQQLAGRLTVLKPRHQALNFDRLLADYRMNITGGDFDSKTRVKRQHDDQLLWVICSSGQYLIDATEKAFAENFCKS